MTLERIFLKDGRLRPVLRVLVYGAAFVILTGLLWVVLAWPLGIVPTASPTLPYRTLLVSEIASATAAVAAAVILRRYLDRRSVASLGLSFGAGWVRCLGIGLLLGAGMQALVFAMELAVGSARFTGFAPLADDVGELARYVPLFVLVSITEEMLVRGYAFQNLWEEFGVVPAVAVTAAIFAALHLHNPGSHENVWFTIGGLAAYGVWACVSVVWTRSLWLAIGVHTAWNLFEGPVFGFPVSGLGTGTPMIAQTFRGPEWFSGGAFGPESGASALIAMAAGFLVLWWLYRRRVFADVMDAREAYAKL